MNAILDWLESGFAQIPFAFLDVWGRFSFVIGAVLAVCAFGGFTFRAGGGWALGRERQAWDGKAVLSMLLTFVLIVGSGYVGSFIVLVPGAQTFESLKDLAVLLCILVFGYPALVTVPLAYGLSDLIEHVPPASLFAWLPGYFINPACFWIAYQLLGRDPDFRHAGTWIRYAAFVLLFMSLEPVLWGFICGGTFTPEVSYRSVTPALMLTTSVTWIIAPFAMLGALPLARRCGLFWAEIEGHVHERVRGAKEWMWVTARGRDAHAADATSDALPVRMYILVPFVALLLAVIGATAYVTLKSAHDDATKLALRLHEEIAGNIDMRLDDYLAGPQPADDAARVAAIGAVLHTLPIAESGRAFIVDRTGKLVASSASNGDSVVASAVASLQQPPRSLATLRASTEWQFDRVTAKPSRDTWLARAVPYVDRSGAHADWIVATVMPEAYYLAGIQAGNSRFAMISAFALLLSVVVAGVLASMVTAPIRRIARAAGALSSGDLSMRAPPSRLRELGALADSFNEMGARLKASFDELRVSEQEIRTHHDHLEELIRDRTIELREAKDEADSASRAKTVFFANMSHEIRTPLNAVLGFAQVLERSPAIGAADRAHVQTILRSGQHLLSLINDVLDMAKIEAGRLTLRTSTFDLHGVLDDVHRMMAIRAEQKGIGFTVERGADVPRYVTLDEPKLRRILINVLDNAVKFTSEGRVTMRVNPPGTDAGERLVIEVEDTGPGISADELPLVFHAFVQTATGTASREGTGLGMPLSLEYARLMGGDLTVVSEAGRGAVFRLDIPVTRATVGDSSSVVARPVVGVRGAENLRVLVADDNGDNRRLITTLLDGVGLQHREAASGFDAIAQWRAWLPHVVFMDIRMPDIDGYETTRRIRAAEGSRQTKIIAVSASVLDRKPDLAREAGIDAFVWKPFSANELFEQLASVTGYALEYADYAPATGERELTRERMDGLDDGLRARMRAAVASADARGLARAIGEIEPRDAGLAGALRALADRYEYDRLAALL